ncbi:MAG: hypothetical protein DRO15_07275 [Thermoprotei archaeon]|nr:MAG: hypothetical protein DRO15_07275 [Thermoprotei archaeon]
MEKAYLFLVIGLIIGLAVGIAAGWFIKPTPAPTALCAYPRGKFTEPPPPGQEVVIVHGFDANYPPFTVVLPNGTPAGFDIDVMKWIANKYGWKIVFKPWDWATIVTALEKGDLDIIASGMTFNAERSKKIWFSVPYYSYIHEIIVRADETRSVEEILNSGEYIAVQLGSTADKWADRLLNKGYNFQKLGLDSYVAALEALLDGRAVACITDSAFFNPYIKQHPEIADKVKVLTTLGAPEVYAIATRPEDKWLRDKINEALEELMHSPKWDELLEKWGLK